MVRIKKKLEIIIDTREQKGYKFEKYEDVSPIVKGLKTGDYSVVGYENLVGVERKNPMDAISSVISGRERFKREWVRGTELLRFAIVIECNMCDLKKHITKQWRIINKSALKRKKNKYRLYGFQKSVPNTYISWSAEFGVPVFFCKNAKEAEKVTYNFLKSFVKKYKKGEIK